LKNCFVHGTYQNQTEHKPDSKRVSPILFPQPARAFGGSFGELLKPNRIFVHDFTGSLYLPIEAVGHGSQSNAIVRFDDLELIAHLQIHAVKKLSWHDYAFGIADLVNGRFHGAASLLQRRL
jgi:hypothetical protein